MSTEGKKRRTTGGVLDEIEPAKGRGAHAYLDQDEFNSVYAFGDDTEESSSGVRKRKFSTLYDDDVDEREVKRSKIIDDDDDDNNVLGHKRKLDEVCDNTDTKRRKIIDDEDYDEPLERPSSISWIRNHMQNDGEFSNIESDSDSDVIASSFSDNVWSDYESDSDLRAQLDSRDDDDSTAQEASGFNQAGFPGIPIFNETMFSVIESHYENVMRERRASTYIPQLHEAHTNRTYWVRRASGDEKMSRLREVLDEFGYVRTEQQVIFHEAMVNACLPRLYDKELAAHMERLLAENNWDDIIQEVLIVTPRRMGKTWSVAMFVAAALIVIPMVEIVIFSMAMRASRKMLGLVDKFLSLHQEGNSMVCRPHTQESLTLMNGDNDKRLCLSFPGKAEVCFNDFSLALTVCDVMLLMQEPNVSSPPTIHPSIHPSIAY